MGTVYARAIIDELGHLVEYASELTEAEINKMLEEHPEWRLTTIELEEGAGFYE